MEIKVLSFASASDAIGRDELLLPLQEGATVAQLRARLDELYPALGGLWERLAVAVDGEIAGAEHVLVDGAEVALLPPVSGGSPEPRAATGRDAAPRRSPRSRLTERAIDVEAATRAVAHPAAGAVVVFVGNVRNHHQGRDVERITYSAYRAMAESRLARIEEELEEQRPGLQVAICHRLGVLEVAEASIVIAVSSAHRGDAYDASREALERVKAEVPIWKREHYAGGEQRWREEEPLQPSSGS